MSWLTNFIRPKIRSLVEAQKDVPDNMWQKCPSCEGMLFTKDLPEALYVCQHCDHHLAQPVKDRLKMLFDNGQYEDVRLPKALHDPLKFKDTKKYADRLRTAQHDTKMADAICVTKGQMNGQTVVISAFNFAFMGGSMGSAVGTGIVEGAKAAIKAKAPYIIIPSSGGARMQEGALSLMQMPRTTVAIQMLKDAGLPYIVLLTHPTTGGVSASFAMLGDIHIAEPGAMIGFAGKRVIQETIREELPDGFQTAEYLLEHGMVDMVVPRGQLKETISRLLSLLTKRNDVARNSLGGRKRLAAPSSKNKSENIARLEEKARVVALNTAANLNKKNGKLKRVG
jgi:acetyl-CoA carboxylase carboxyl transferase subunit beta